MKKIGIVGGLGPESTLNYYQGLIEGFKVSYEQTGYPEICIESMDLKAFMELINEGAWDQIAETVAQRFEALRRVGAQVGAIASNTPHKVFEQIQSQTALPLISIIEATCDHAVTAKLGTLCLMGTEVTMAGDFYQRVFDRQHIELVVPKPDEIAYIQKKLFSEIEFGVIKTETRQRFLSILTRIQREHPIDGIILGCTELPLIIKAEDVDIPYLDTTAIHVTKIIELCKEA